ncbi:MAG: YitT family protein [Lachnospiraceae bacterium]|nr:YitT family protein [Lachnospiraceae bacterium]
MGRKILTREIKQEIKSVIFIIIGALMAAFSVACILIPNDAIDYGTAGIGIIISQLTGFNLAICIFLVFAPFLFFSYFALGLEFFLKALVGSFVYTVGIQLFGKVPFELNTEHFIAVAFGGAILGAGLSIILKNGGCIDGSEIFANILIDKIYQKKGKEYSMSLILVLFNVFVYLLVFIFIDENKALMSLLVFIVASTVINHFTDHFEAVKQVTIITKDPEGIIKDITDKLHKTCTVIESSGAISGENKTLICYVNYFELDKIKHIIASHEGSFSTVSTIDEIITYN